MADLVAVIIAERNGVELQFKEETLLIPSNIPLDGSGFVDTDLDVAMKSHGSRHSPGGVDPISLPYQSVTQTNVVSTTSTSAVLIPDMTITPDAGRYLVSFSLTLQGSLNSVEVTCSIYVGETLIPESELTFNRAAASARTPLTISSVLAEPNGAQAIEARWRVSGGTGTSNFRRSMRIVRIG
jgi:hypothetical protein